MKRFLFLLGFGAASAHAQTPWSAGVHTGANWILDSQGEWEPGPSMGLNAGRSLSRSLEWRVLVRFSPMLQKGPSALVTEEGFQNGAEVDTLSLHRQYLTGIRYAPTPEEASEKRTIRPVLEASLGVDSIRTHSDLAGVEGFSRVSQNRLAPMAQVHLGFAGRWYDAFEIHLSTGGQVFLTLDSAEREGEDLWRVFFGLQPSLDFNGHF